MSASPSVRRTILLVSGCWGQNIGNAFFNVGGLEVLRRAFPDHNVQFIQDQPGYWTFNRRRVNPPNDWGLLARLDVDYVVLQGPVFSLALTSLWAETLEALYRRGTRVIYLSAALFRHTPEEVAAARAFLQRFPPAMLSTRDAETHAALGDLAEHAYSGICSAWFVPDVYEPPALHAERYIVANFDRWLEPRLSLGSGAGEGAEEGVVEVPLDGERLTVRRPAHLDRLSDRGKASAYLAAAIDRRVLPDRIGPYDIVRAEHRSNPRMSWKIYRRPNAVISDEPFTYFTLYANARLTLTDRVHACLMSLAYGRPAMLFTTSPRSRLFTRLGLHGITREPTTLDPAVLEREKAAQMAFLHRTARALDGTTRR